MSRNRHVIHIATRRPLRDLGLASSEPARPGVWDEEDVRDDSACGESSNLELELRYGKSAGSRHDDLDTHPECLDDGERLDQKINFILVMNHFHGDVWNLESSRFYSLFGAI